MFKKGEKVRCIRNDGGIRALTIGNVYTVLEDQRGPSYVRLADDDRRDGPQTWFANRFELVEPAKADVPAKAAKAAEPKANAAIMGPYAKGDKLICVKPFDGVNKIALNAIVTFVQAHGALVSLDEYPGLKFSANRFQRAVFKPKVIEIGSRVVFARPDHDKFSNGKNEYVGQEFTVGRRFQDGRGRYANHVFLNELYYQVDMACLDLVGGAQELVLPTAAIIAPKAPDAPNYTGNLCQELRERKANSGYPEHHITSFAVVKKGSKEAKFFIDPACYAPMGRLGFPIEQFAVDTTGIAIYFNENKRSEDAIRYLNWALNSSPWADMFITKDGKEAYEKNILIDTKYTISQIVGAGIMIRELREQAGRLNMFIDVLNRGYSGNMAYLVSNFVNKNDKGLYSLSFDGGGHCCLVARMSAKELFTFFKEGYRVLKGKPANEKNEPYSIFNAICESSIAYGGAAKDTIQDWFTGNVKVKTTGSGWDKVESIPEEQIVALLKLLKQHIGG